MSEILPFPEYQRLRMPTGWEISRNEFFDLEPKEELLVEGNADNNGWSLFEQELLYLKYKKQNTVLDKGWIPNYNPTGQFSLSIIENEDWQNDQIACETRSKAEIVEAVEQTMLRISRKNGDYNVEAEGIRLQELRFTTIHWKVVRNELFDLDPKGEMRVTGLPNEDGWQLLHEDLLHLELYNDAKVQIRLGWFPAHDKQGAFRILATTDKYYEPPLVNFSTTDKIEAVEIIEHLIKEIHYLKPLEK